MKGFRCQLGLLQLVWCRKSKGWSLFFKDVTELFSFSNVELLEVVVGDSKTRFRVHKDIFITSARTFRAISRQADRDLLIEDADAVVFDYFVQWLYYGPERTLSSLKSDDCFMRLARLQLFAETFSVPALRNDIVWELFHLRSKNEIPPMSVVEYAFLHLADSSFFRTLLVDWYTWPPRRRSDHEIPTLEELERVSRFACEFALSQATKADRDPFLVGPKEYYVELEEDMVEDRTSVFEDEWAKSRSESDSVKSG